jgi:hypothetical protein
MFGELNFERLVQRLEQSFEEFPDLRTGKISSLSGYVSAAEQGRSVKEFRAHTNGLLVAMGVFLIVRNGCFSVLQWGPVSCSKHPAVLDPGCG